MENSSSDGDYEPSDSSESEKDTKEQVVSENFATDETLDNSDMKTRYRACMILSGVGIYHELSKLTQIGDALGYKNGIWEVRYSISILII